MPNAAGWPCGPDSGIWSFGKRGWPRNNELPSGARMVAFPGYRDPSMFENLDWVYFEMLCGTMSGGNTGVGIGTTASTFANTLMTSSSAAISRLPGRSSSTSKPGCRGKLPTSGRRGGWSLERAAASC
jgi:hypothetical protein